MSMATDLIVKDYGPTGVGQDRREHCEARLAGHLAAQNSINLEAYRRKAKERDRMQMNALRRLMRLPELLA